MKLLREIMNTALRIQLKAGEVVLRYYVDSFLVCHGISAVEWGVLRHICC